MWAHHQINYVENTSFIHDQLKVSPILIKVKFGPAFHSSSYFEWFRFWRCGVDKFLWVAVEDFFILFFFPCYIACTVDDLII